MFRFDLLEEEWLPCVMPDDSVREVGLREALISAQDIRELFGDWPPETIALHRLLLAILHRALGGPVDADDWYRIKQAGRFEGALLDEYFEKWRGRFDLFDETYPFYQAASAMSRVKKGYVIQLSFHGRNNGTLFDHTTSLDPGRVTAAEAARRLVTIQGFDSGSLKADGAATAAPLIQSSVLMVKGENLFETLLKNLHRYDPKDAVPFPFDHECDMPAWERETDTDASEREPDGYVDLLTWQARRIWLQPEPDGLGGIAVRNSVIMRGHTIPASAERQEMETMNAFRMGEGGIFFAPGFGDGRGVWRRSVSFLETVRGESHRPKMFDWLSELITRGLIDGASDLTAEFYGLEADRAKPLQSHRESLAIPAAFLINGDLVADLKAALRFAEAVGYVLDLCVRRLSEMLKTKADAFPIVRDYWARLECEFTDLLAGLASGKGDAVENWMRAAVTASGVARQRVEKSLGRTAAELKAILASGVRYRNGLNFQLAAHREALEQYLPDVESFVRIALSEQDLDGKGGERRFPTEQSELDADRLISFLRSMRPGRDRLVFDELRRLAYGPMLDGFHSSPWIRRFLSNDDPGHNRAVFLVSSMFAHYHDAPLLTGDFGESVRRLRNFGGGIGRRLFVTVNAGPDDLGRLLLDLIRHLKKRKIGIDWRLLFGDLASWSDGNAEVPKRWIRSYWGIECTDVEPGTDETSMGVSE